jgi:hypothetical protein
MSLSNCQRESRDDFLTLNGVFTMAKATSTIQSGETLTFTGLSDLGYKQAKIGDSLIQTAKYALEKISGFPEEISPEAKAELYAGYFKRYSETHPPVMYAIINGHYVQASVEHIDNKSVEKIAVGVDYAFALTAQEFGKLKNTEPEKHALVAKVRDAVQTYASNRLSDLKRAAKKLIEPSGATRSRTTLDFVQSVQKALDYFEGSVKVKAGKGDTTADVVRFRMARDAFWKAYNAK